MKLTFDASLAAAYDFVSATTYIFKGKELSSSYKNLYLEATVGADLNKFEVPVSVSVKAKNIVDKSDVGIDLSASATYAKDAITAGTSFGINLKTSAWSLKAYGIYVTENFTAGTNVQYAASTKAVMFGAFAESSAIIEGATIGVNYGLDNDTAIYYGGSYCVSNAINSNSFSSETTNAGTFGAYCIINF